MGFLHVSFLSPNLYLLFDCAVFGRIRKKDFSCSEHTQPMCKEKIGCDVLEVIDVPFLIPKKMGKV
jgi:hypothetical protein